MHILYVVHGYKPAFRFGGPIWSVCAVAEEMVARGHRVTVFATNSNLNEDLDVPVDQPIQVDGVEVWYFKHLDLMRKYFWWLPYLSQSMGYLYAPAMRRAIIEILPSVDLVHTQMPFVYPGAIAGHLANSAHKPLFYNQRGSFHSERLKYRGLKKKLYIDLIEKPIMRKASGLIALTTEEVDSYRALGIQTPCHIIPNGIDIARFRRTARPDSLLDLQITSTSQVILFLGRLHPSKGVDLLVDAFSKIAVRHPDAVLVVAGPDEHGFAQELSNEAAQRNLTGRVILPGMVEGDRKIELLARSDLFVLPSTGEGFSIAILEALASGTPVIISPECHFPEVAQVGAGVIIERNVELLATAISKFLSDPQRLKTAADAAYTLARDHYGWIPIVDRLEKTYRSTIDQLNEEKVAGVT